MFNLIFTVQSDWNEGVEKILKIAERIKEEHPNEQLKIEVQFHETQKYKN